MNDARVSSPASYPLAGWRPVWGRPGALALPVCVALGTAHAARADWTFSILQPAGATRSIGYGADGGSQGGHAKYSDFQHAALWSGSAGSFVDLSPSGSANSYVLGMGGG